MKALLAAALFAAATGAHAHAELVASSPPDGATLGAAPAAIELRFSEPVQPIAHRLVDGSGRPLALPAARGEGATLTVPLPDGLARDQYLFSYRVTSLDSHPVGGSIAFGIGVAPPAARAASSDALGVVRIAVRALRDLALLVAAGGALFAAALGRFPGQARLLPATAVAGILASLAGVGLQGAALLGESHAFASREAWETAANSSFGLSAGFALAGLALIAAARGRAPAMTAGAVLAIASLPLTGHAQIAHPMVLAATALAAHGVAAAYWAGSLAALLLVLANEPQRAALALRRFSPLGVAAVAMLVAAGIALAWLHLRAPAQLAESPYGRLILGKVALLALLVALAARNRWRLLPSLERGEPRARRALQHAIAAEALLIAIVIGLTAVLVQTPPPQLAQTQRFTSSTLDAELAVAPGRAGTNTLTVRLRDRAGGAIDAPEVSLEFANPAAGIEPLARTMRRVSAGAYRHEGAELAFAGVWDVVVHARIDDFERISFTARVTIR